MGGTRVTMQGLVLTARTQPDLPATDTGRSRRCSLTAENTKYCIIIIIVVLAIRQCAA